MPAISPPGATSSLWVNVPMPTPVQAQPQQQQPAQQQQPMMPPPQPRSWVPPPLTLLPHADATDPQHSPYGQRSANQYARAWLTQYARFGSDIGESPWIPHGVTPHILLINAHQLANEFYDNPNPETLKAYQKGMQQAEPHIGEDTPEARLAGVKASDEQAFAHLLSMSFDRGRTVSPEHVKHLRDMWEANDTGDPLPLHRFGEWIERHHDDPLARKVADWAKTHARVADAIRSGRRMPPGLVGKIQQYRARDSADPAWGPLSFTKDEEAQASDRFLQHFTHDPIHPAIGVAKLRNNRAGRAQGAGIPDLNDPKYRLKPRAQQPERYSRQEIEPIARGLAEKPHDANGWAALSDLMMENGKPAISDALLPLVHNGDAHFYPAASVHNVATGKRDTQKPEGAMRADPIGAHALRDQVSEMPISGYAHGLGLSLHPGSGTDHEGKVRDTYVLHVHRPSGSPGVHGVMGIVTLGRKHATEVLRDMEPHPDVAGTHAAWLDLLDRFPDPKVDVTRAGHYFKSRYGRGPLRFSREDDLADAHKALVVNPTARTEPRLWSKLSAAMFDHGKRATADLMEKIGKAPLFEFRGSQAGRLSYPDHDPQKRMRKTTTTPWPEHVPIEIHGVPIWLTRWNGSDYGKPAPAVYRASVYPPGGPDGSGPLAMATVDPHQAKDLLAEAGIDYPFWPEVNAAHRTINDGQIIQKPAEQFSAFRAPAGGMVTRGIYQPGGEFLPVEAVGGQPNQSKIRELLARWKLRRRTPTRTQYSRGEENHHSWMDPSGNFYPVPSHIGHGAWAEQQGMGGEQQLLSQGWHRVFPYGRDQLATHNELVPPNSRQRSALSDLAMMTGIRDVTHIGPYPAEPRTIWSADEQFARPGRPIRYSAEDIAGIHRYLSANPMDKQGWAALSDAFLEHGKGTWADVAGRLAKPWESESPGDGTSYRHGLLRDRRTHFMDHDHPPAAGTSWDGGHAMIHAGGMRLEIAKYKRPEADPLYPTDPYVYKGTFRKSTPQGAGMVMGGATLRPQHVAALMREADGFDGQVPWWDDVEQYNNHPGPQKYGRPGQPVRYEGNDPLSNMYRFLASDENHLNPQTYAALSDTFREHGMDATADALAGIFQHGKPQHFTVEDRQPTDPRGPSGNTKYVGQMTADPHGFLYPQTYQTAGQVPIWGKVGPMNASFVRGFSRHLRGSGELWNRVMTMELRRPDEQEDHPEHRIPLARIHLPEEHAIRIMDEAGIRRPNRQDFARQERPLPTWVPTEDPNAPDPSLTGFAPVQSSWIAGLKYKPGEGTSMTVKKGGKEYPYRGLNLAMFRAWLASKSPGRWWWRHIGYPMRGQGATARGTTAVA